jgi:hypothetical protein
MQLVRDGFDNRDPMAATIIVKDLFANPWWAGTFRARNYKPVSPLRYLLCQTRCQLPAL